MAHITLLGHFLSTQLTALISILNISFTWIDLSCSVVILNILGGISFVWTNCVVGISRSGVLSRGISCVLTLNICGCLSTWMNSRIYGRVVLNYFVRTVANNLLRLVVDLWGGTLMVSIVAISNYLLTTWNVGYTITSSILLLQSLLLSIKLNLVDIFSPILRFQIVGGLASISTSLNWRCNHHGLRLIWVLIIFLSVAILGIGVSIRLLMVWLWSVIGGLEFWWILLCVCHTRVLNRLVHLSVSSRICGGSGGLHNRLVYLSVTGACVVHMFNWGINLVIWCGCILSVVLGMRLSNWCRLFIVILMLLGLQMAILVV